ncbi:MAG: hypothetical protein AAF465_10390 [Pseudomonadota bacterium]
MYDLKHLLGIARDGFSDMVPALRQAFNERRDDDRLDAVFGSSPRHRIVGLTIGGLIIGEIVTVLFPAIVVDAYIINEYVNWSAMIIGMAFAVLFRRYLFVSGKATRDDFPWLAASLIPAAIVIALIAFGRQLFDGSLSFIEDAPRIANIATILVALAHSVGVVAALTIAVAALCFSRDWLKALMDLAVQLLVFKIMVWVTVLVVIEISIVGRILAGVLEGAFGIRLPAWLPETADQVTLAALLLTAYCAIIGAVWTVCRQQFGTLLDTGEVRIVTVLRKMASKPSKKKTKRQAEKSRAE